MKYIKSFESTHTRLELLQFCRNYLANLVDNGTKITVFNKGDYYELDINNSKGGTWKDIKYDFIPFFQMLNENYKILTFKNRIGVSENRHIKLYGIYHTKNAILNDRIDDRSPIGFISMHIKKDTIKCLFLIEEF